VSKLLSKLRHGTTVLVSHDNMTTYLNSVEKSGTEVVR